MCLRQSDFADPLPLVLANSRGILEGELVLKTREAERRFWAIGGEGEYVKKCDNILLG